MKVADWEDYACFTEVARHGGLRGAAEALQVSVPTVSRRMRAFEARLGRRLFLHGAAGYTLTAEGRALWERTQRMEAAAAEIEGWRASATGPVPVRISAGTWTALHFTERLREIWSPGAIWLPELVHCERPMDLARREIDIGLRNERPEQPWLAGRRVGTTQFAIFAAGPEIAGWIGPSEDAPKTKSARWLEAEHGAEIVTRANAPLFALQLARAGVGRVVLPLSVGDGRDDLVRLSDPIAELESEQWLVLHQDTRHDPPIRAAADALAAFFTREAREQATPISAEHADGM
ncbi:MAG: LysR family transcriptional regulator [Pseudomonadota bacterium]